MIEAPEALYLAKQIEEIIKGKTVTEVVLGYTPHKFMFLADEPENCIALLMHRKAEKARAVGGMVEINFEDTIVAFTDGMNIRYYEPGEKLPAKHQMLIGFDDESCLVGTIRMYGGMLCFKEGDFSAPISSYYLTSVNKPQVMGEEFTKAYFIELINDESAQKKSVKAFLATEQSIPGLGNGVLQDILYNAEIHPKTKIKAIAPEQRSKLYNSVKSTLTEIYENRGRNTETDLFGVNGNYIPWLSKDTVGKECPRCDSIIQKESYMGGSIYYCSGCQLRL